MPGQIEQKPGVGQRIGPQGDRRLVADQLAFAVQPSQEPVHQRMEKEWTANDLLSRLGEVVPAGQVRELVQQAGAAV